MAAYDVIEVIKTIKKPHRSQGLVKLNAINQLLAHITKTRVGCPAGQNTKASIHTFKFFITWLRKTICREFVTMFSCNRFNRLDISCFFELTLEAVVAFGLSEEALELCL